MKAAKKSSGKKIKSNKAEEDDELSEIEKDYTEKDGLAIKSRIGHARKLWSIPTKGMASKKKTSKEPKKYSAEWLNSKGFSIVKVKCACCGKVYEEVVENVRKKETLKNDVFFCGKCT